MILARLISVFLLLPFAIGAQKNYPSLLDEFMQAHVRINQFSGVVLIEEKGKILYKKAFGLANREWNVPNTVDTKFRIASITKQFTAAAILQLVDKGELSLEDKLSKYFPDFPKGDSVTIHMLLNHTSGINSSPGLSIFAFLPILAHSKDSFVAVHKKQPYDFSPGVKYKYNNFGYFLLGYIIEKVTGQPYSSYLLENVIKKAGLGNTALDQLDSVLPNRATGYLKSPAGWRNASLLSMQFPNSSGGMFSTVEDLNKWEKALFGGKIISSAMLDKMTTPYQGKYGYGLGIDSLQTHKRIAHVGRLAGFFSCSSRYPSDRVSIVVLSNNLGNAAGISQALAATLFDIPVIPPYHHKEVAIDTVTIEKFIGKYQRTNSFSVDTLVSKEGRFYIHFQGGDQYELKSESKTKYFLAMFPDIKLELNMDIKEKVSKAYYIDTGVKVEMIKL